MTGQQPGAADWPTFDCRSRKQAPARPSALPRQSRPGRSHGSRRVDSGRLLVCHDKPCLERPFDQVDQRRVPPSCANRRVDRTANCGATAIGW
jgi:hypothetical protein